VAEVLEVMIDQNETAIRTDERTLLQTQLTRAHILGNAKDDEHRSEKALDIYLTAMEKSAALVREAREKLALAKAAQIEKGDTTVDTDDEDSSSESTPILGHLRNNLRTSVQLQHACTFFAATAYYQIKVNENLTIPDSEQFKALEEKETTLYERAKVLRKEILRDNARKSENLMKKIGDLANSNAFTQMPAIKELGNWGGIESRRIMEKSDDLFDVIGDLAGVISTWRAKMAEYLLKPLVDKDEGNEITGDEYEDSTKQQDELYVYFDAIKAMQADLNTFVAAVATPLIDVEVKSMIKAAKAKLDPDIVDDMKEGDVHAPELTLELLNIRQKFKAKKEEVGSVKGLIHEARTLENSLGFYDSGMRAAEREFIRRHLQSLQRVFNDYTKASDGLEKEVALFRTTQNQRIEFYRQLQEVSDTVKPYKEELDERLDLNRLQIVMQREEEQKSGLAQLMTKNRFLVHLRDENSSKDEQRLCVICQTSFETGVLTVCGHQFCKECILHWWQQSKTCPVCKRKLSMVDFHNVTYKARNIRAQEEVHSGSSSPGTEDTPSPSRNTSIYSDADTQLMQEIKAIDLPTSYGTKIDTLGRHLHWIREHDPGAKSIVFSQYREFLNVLGTALQDFKIGYSRLGTPRAVERFKSDPSVDCLLLDAKTDSSGMTLVNATHVFICEPLIQTAVELQAIARVHRIGQTRPTTVWMYLINDTVEESIYEISVARRLAHVQARQPNRMQKSRSATPAPLAENAIDAANSEELQSAPISKLLVNSKSGGEVVNTDDLWQCLFGKAQKATFKPSVEAEIVVGRHLRAEAAESRRDQALAQAQY
jgi:E3 ubiquitin-protein ligase SHPRH